MCEDAHLLVSLFSASSSNVLEAFVPEIIPRYRYIYGLVYGGTVGLNPCIYAVFSLSRRGNGRFKSVLELCAFRWCEMIFRGITDICARLK